MDEAVKLRIERLNEYDEIWKFRTKVENAKGNLDLADYYHRIIYSLLQNDNKDILKENKNMILSNVNNLLDVIYKVRKFAEDEL